MPQDSPKEYRVHAPDGMRSKLVTAAAIAAMHQAGKIPAGSTVTDSTSQTTWPVNEFLITVHRASAGAAIPPAIKEIQQDSESIPFVCPNCHAKLRGKRSHVGRLIPCPGCKIPVEIPAIKNTNVDTDAVPVADPDVLRHIGYLAFSAVKLVNDASESDRELASWLMCIFMFAKKPEDKEIVRSAVVARTTAAWEILKQLWSLLEKHGTHHSGPWSEGFDRMMMAVNAKPTNSNQPQQLITIRPEWCWNSNRTGFNVSTSVRSSQSNPDHWRNLRSVPFEKFLAAGLQQLGFRIRATATTGDQGVDLIATRNNIRLAIQAKGYAGTVGNDAVQQVFAGMQYYDCNCCAVLTNSQFTPQARELAMKLRCILVGESDLIDFLRGKIQIEELLQQMNR